ncbi:hypothetical protein [Vibrio parahaemolyticus]|uniref:hypothetical protein n=1 Tax=Vibrio parahaemolyticus TaxID=670 RepID=UPI000D530B37|nr:hypothetical protein [Vibrio parahaemolyticus]AWG86472.1 hypothetical protein Vp2S01_A0987 [Vibrio parahaemolyticus]
MSNVYGSKVLLIKTSSGDRFFTRFGKGGSVRTAWSLAGACHFLLSADLISVTEKLDAKKKKYAVHEVACSTIPAPAELLRGGWDAPKCSDVQVYDCPKVEFDDGVPF